jgi:hypothetical protein
VFAVAAAVLFVIAFLLDATKTHTSAVFSPMSLALAGLAFLAFHLALAGVAPGLRRRPPA